MLKKDASSRRFMMVWLKAVRCWSNYVAALALMLQLWHHPTLSWLSSPQTGWMALEVSMLHSEKLMVCTRLMFVFTYLYKLPSATADVGSLVVCAWLFFLSAHVLNHPVVYLPFLNDRYYLLGYQGVLGYCCSLAQSPINLRHDVNGWTSILPGQPLGDKGSWLCPVFRDLAADNWLLFSLWYRSAFLK